MKRDFDRRHNPKRKKDMSQTQCFHCKKFGHFKAQCPKRFNEGRKEWINMLPWQFEEHSKKSKFEGDKDHLYYLSLAWPLSDDNICLIENGASRHMKGENDHLTCLMELQDIWKERMSTTFIELETGESVHLSNILYVLGLKKNLVSISCLEDRWDILTFIDGKFLVWGNGSGIIFAKVIGIHEGILYKLLGKSFQTLLYPGYSFRLRPRFWASGSGSGLRILVSYGIRDMHTSILKPWHLWSILFQVYLICRWIIMMCARDAILEILLRNHSQVVNTGPNIFWI